VGMSLVLIGVILLGVSFIPISPAVIERAVPYYQIPILGYWKYCVPITVVNNTGTTIFTVDIPVGEILENIHLSESDYGQARVFWKSSTAFGYFLPYYFDNEFLGTSFGFEGVPAISPDENRVFYLYLVNPEATDEMDRRRNDYFYYGHWLPYTIGEIQEQKLIDVRISPENWEVLTLPMENSPFKFTLEMVVTNNYIGQLWFDFSCPVNWRWSSTEGYGGFLGFYHVAPVWGNTRVIGFQVWSETLQYENEYHFLLKVGYGSGSSKITYAEIPLVLHVINLPENAGGVFLPENIGLETLSPINVTENSAILSGKVWENVENVWVYFEIFSPYYYKTPEIFLEKGGHFSFLMENLPSKTIVQYCACARIDEKIYRGDPVTFETLGVKPKILVQWEKVGIENFVAHVVLDRGDYPVGQIWFYCYDTSTMEKVAEMKQSVAFYEKREVELTWEITGLNSDKVYRWNFDYVYDNERIRGEYRDVRVLPKPAVISSRDIARYGGILSIIAGIPLLMIPAPVMGRRR